MNTRQTHLKIRIKNLSDESKTIRSEERRAKRFEDHELRESLHLHRVGVVRTASRHANLANACIRGVSYARLEMTSRTEPNWREVQKTAKRFGCDDATWDAWREDARLGRTRETLAAA